MKKRNEVAKADCWNVEALYSSFSEWELAFARCARACEKSPYWPEIAAFKGKIGEGAKVLLDLLTIYFNIDRELSKLYTYAHLRHDEDVTADLAKNSYGRIESALFDFRQESAWIEPEFLELSQEKIAAYLKDPLLDAYKVFIEKIARLKPHTLSSEAEMLMAQSGKALETAQGAFRAFNNADLKFPSVKNSEGKEMPLSHGTFALYLREKDRVLREEAFKAVHKSFGSFENTLCELIHGQVQRHLFDTRARKYVSCLESALFPNQIDTGVYHALINAVRSRLGSLHRYMHVRKKMLGYTELHLYDLHVPLIGEAEMSMGYDDAAKLVVASVKPLGEEYQNALAKGLLEAGWVDRYENRNKRSGAYSSGCFDSMPYILMNYHGTFNDMMTLAHEAGHSMHTYLSAKHQPYHYSRYPIFVAEVASTFNQELMFRHLFASTTDRRQRAYLLNQKIDDLRATLFRQVMFAEFELTLHSWAERGIPFTPSLLKQEYKNLNQAYYGSDVVIDDEIEVEWARIPHFYYDFYVYQYATGISAAIALSEKVMKEGKQARDGYLQFLSSGCSRYPIDLLRIAGVEIQTSDPVHAAIDHFDGLVQELEKTY